MKRYEYILLVVAVGAMAFSLGHEYRPDPVTVDCRTVVKYIPVFQPLPKHFKLKPIKESELRP